MDKPPPATSYQLACCSLVVVVVVTIQPTGFLRQLGKYLVSLSTARVTSHTVSQFPLIIITPEPDLQIEIFLPCVVFYLKYFL